MDSGVNDSGEMTSSSYSNGDHLTTESNSYKKRLILHWASKHFVDSEKFS